MRRGGLEREAVEPRQAPLGCDAADVARVGQEVSRRRFSRPSLFEVEFIVPPSSFFRIARGTDGTFHFMKRVAIPVEPPRRSQEGTAMSNRTIKLVLLAFVVIALSGCEDLRGNRQQQGAVGG